MEDKTIEEKVRQYETQLGRLQKLIEDREYLCREAKSAYRSVYSLVKAEYSKLVDFAESAGVDCPYKVRIDARLRPDVTTHDLIASPLSRCFIFEAFKLVEKKESDGWYMDRVAYGGNGID